MSYLFFAILAALNYGIYNFLIGRSATKINPFLGTVFFTATSVTVAAIALLIYRFTGKTMEFSVSGARIAVLAGVFAGLAEIFYFFAFSRNSTVSVVLPVVFLVTVLTGVALGFTINSEPVTGVKILGIALGLLSIFLLAR